MKKHVKIVFTISIILNMLFAGMLAGMAMRPDAPPSWRDEKLMAALSPEARSLMDENFKATHEKLHPVFLQAREKRKELIGVIEAERFDPDAYRRKAAELRSLQDKIMDSRVVTAGTLAAQLKQEDRRLMSEWLAGPRRGGGKGGPQGKKPD